MFTGVSVPLCGLRGESRQIPESVLIAFSGESRHFSQTHGSNPVFEDHAAAEALFDALHDVVFFPKDATARYVVVNRIPAGRRTGNSGIPRDLNAPGE